MISATWWTNSTIYIPEYSQFWFQHAALNLITKSYEFTLLQYSTTLSSLITSFCIIFDICNMINYRFIYIPEYSQFWFQHAALNLITTRREFTLLQYSTTLSSIIASFCIIFDICYMMNQQCYIYSRILPVSISTCYIEFNNYKTWIYSITVFYNTLKLNHIILYHIWYLQHDKLPFYIYSRILPVLISTCCIEFNHYKTWIYSITVFYNTLMHNRIIMYHIWYLLHDEPTVLYIFQNTPSFDFNMLHWI